MSDSKKFAIAARLFVQLRRKTNRSIDTVWMLQSSEYAREILRVARAQDDDELQGLAGQFERLMGDVASISAAAAPSVIGKTYIGTLR
jgi:hypothetical protein